MVRKDEERPVPGPLPWLPQRPTLRHRRVQRDDPRSVEYVPSGVAVVVSADVLRAIVRNPNPVHELSGRDSWGLIAGVMGGVAYPRLAVRRGARCRLADASRRSSLA